jgi:hypothetical protein
MNWGQFNQTRLYLLTGYPLRAEHLHAAWDHRLAAMHPERTANEVKRTPMSAGASSEKT